MLSACDHGRTFERSGVLRKMYLCSHKILHAANKFLMYQTLVFTLNKFQSIRSKSKQRLEKIRIISKLLIFPLPIIGDPLGVIGLKPHQ